ncbi:MAG: hypothetical protein RR405_06420, partial [Clostridia bacterium]
MYFINKKDDTLSSFFVLFLVYISLFVFVVLFLVDYDIIGAHSFEACLYRYLSCYEVAKIVGDAHDKLSHAEEQLVRQFADNLIKVSANKRH